jgi:RNA chaperone Hfq
MKKSTGKATESAGKFPPGPAQDRFLRQMMDEKRKVAVFLLGGVKLEAEIAGFDQHVILMKGATTDQVYKHAVSTIQPIPESRQRPRAGGREGAPRVPVISRRKPRLYSTGGDRS